MQYVEKMSSDELYSKICIHNEKIHTEEFSKMFYSVMDKYNSNTKQFVKDFIKYITDSTSKIDVRYTNMTDEEYLKKCCTFPDDVKTIQKSFLKYGFKISAPEAVSIWETRSNNWFAQWMCFADYENPFMEVVNFGFIDKYTL